MWRLGQSSYTWGMRLVLVVNQAANLKNLFSNAGLTTLLLREIGVLHFNVDR